MGFSEIRGEVREKSLHHGEKGFVNLNADKRDIGLLSWIKFSTGRFREGMTRHNKKPESALKNDGKIIHHNPASDTITWIGHATFLIQLGGVTFLTDPIWSLRASPFSRIGPKRYVEPGLDFNGLPNIDFVIISHDHYDHFDMKTIRRLAGNGVTFFAPPGFKEYFNDMNIKTFKELDWGESANIKGLTIISTVSQHFSGRGLLDRDRSLWAGWAVLGKKKRFFFMGDSGYFKGFEEIGNKYGPFDMAILPISAYLPANIMHYVHMTPEEATQAFLDLKGRIFVPSHWGTFSLSDEPMEEPPIRVTAAAKEMLPSSSGIWLMQQGETRPW